ncbi:hypothetical protein C0J45_18810, partial [Silurus meridionalis]
SPTDTLVSTWISACLADLSAWMAAHQLKLNPSKSELLFIPDRPNLYIEIIMRALKHGLKSQRSSFGAFIRRQIRADPTHHCLQMEVYIVVPLFTHAKLRNMLSISDAEKLVHAFMTSRIDYCNALLGGCPASLINKLQFVQNAAAKVYTRSRKYDHITLILSSLHWLPVTFRIDYKLLLLTYKTLNGLGLHYIYSLLTRYNLPQKSQNSGLLVVPRIAKSTKGGREFSDLAPKLWNGFPDSVRGSDTLSQFKCKLKTYLFSK